MADCRSTLSTHEVLEVYSVAWVNCAAAGEATGNRSSARLQVAREREGLAVHVALRIDLRGREARFRAADERARYDSQDPNAGHPKQPPALSSRRDRTRCSRRRRA